MFEMRPFKERIPDSQYQDLLNLVLKKGEKQEINNQGISCLSYFKPPDLRFDLRNGVPLILERKIGFWTKAVAEIFAMINGARTVSEFEKFGCNWWGQWATKEICESLGLPEGDLGAGSYGVAFHNFPTPGLPDGFNQFEALVKGLREKPYLRTHLISPWHPYFASEFGERQVFVAPCHGWLTFYVRGKRLDMCMDQRSADLPIGVPANLIQYSALLLALAQVTELEPGQYIHTFKNAHIYSDQIPAVKKMITREARYLPTMKISDAGLRLESLFDFRSEHFEISDYNPHPAIPGIPVAL